MRRGIMTLVSGAALMAALFVTSCTETVTAPRTVVGSGNGTMVKLSVKDVTLTTGAPQQIITIEPQVDQNVAWRVRAVGSNIMVAPSTGVGKGTFVVRVDNPDLREGRVQLGELQFDLDAASLGHGSMAKTKPGSGTGAVQWELVQGLTLPVWFIGS
ncbi:MAG: hypothetical protein JST22_14875 [Bacteroidetes bacterium]|nr:hypothetical protein [Bacteroidota bacterium]